MKCRDAGQTTLSGSAKERRLDIAVLSRCGDRQIGQQVKPKPNRWEESFFIAGTVAEQLQGFLTVCVMKMTILKAQAQSLYFPRQRPPSTLSWREPHPISQQAARPR